MPDVVRVALLARAGEVREQLRRALAEAGADVVAEGDPAELDPGTVAGRQPGVVVVSLEPAIEDALAEFDDLLAMPGVQVIYDDAEVTGQLDGWDLARWARHLASKLAGTDSVLPPAPADAVAVPETDLAPEPGAPPTPAQEMDHHRLEDYAAESLDLSEWVPTTPSLTDVPVEPEAAIAAAPADAADGLELDLDLDLAGLEEAMSARPAAPHAEPESAAEPDFDVAAFAAADADEPAPEFAVDALDAESAAEPGATAEEASPDLGDFLDLSVVESFEAEAEIVPSTAAADEPLLVDFEMPEGPVSFSSFASDDEVAAGGVDDDVAALAAQLDAFERRAPREEPAEPDFSRHAEPPLDLDEPAAAPVVAAAAPSAGRAPSSGSFGDLSLTPMDGEASPAAAPAAATAAPKIDFGHLSLVDDAAPAATPTAGRRDEPAKIDFGHLSLADDTAPAAAPARAPVAAAKGALFVIAGLGGPDGVRQLLAALPGDLPVPVLLYQHLDTGKHDRLVGQLAKASRLPVELATAGGDAAAGRVAVLPPGLGLERRGDGLGFVGGGSVASIVAALPAGDSAVLVLSGGDPSVVPAVQALQAAGGGVFAQDPASCFDAGAPQALIAAGATTGALPDLARRIIERWS